ncbi:MAG: response regulator [Endomicrobiales bacterium]|nr:response regulator [Endomicrobiales bacterium]
MEKENILVVDDDAAIARVCTKALQAVGYTCNMVNSAEEAIEALKKSAYHLVVTDLQMPGKSGMDLLHHIKQNYAGCDVIIITSYPSVDTAIEALRAGVYDYIRKPFSVEDLRDKVKKCLDARPEKDKIDKDKEAPDKILTTYQISKLCGVTLTTVTNWVENGLLPAYKTPGGHRRIQREDLLKFLEKHNMPVPDGLK